MCTVYLQQLLYGVHTSADGDANAANNAIDTDYISSVMKLEF